MKRSSNINSETNLQNQRVLVIGGSSRMGLEWHGRLPLGAEVILSVALRDKLQAAAQNSKA